jgi:hypothetical protein
MRQLGRRERTLSAANAPSSRARARDRAASRVPLYTAPLGQPALATGGSFGDSWPGAPSSFCTELPGASTAEEPEAGGPCIAIRGAPTVRESGPASNAGPVVPGEG